MAVRTRRLFTVDEYEAMQRAEIITDDDRVELLDGEIVCKPVSNPPHQSVIDRLTVLFIERLGRRVIVRIQGAVRLPPRSEPEPDVSLLRGRDDYYEAKHPEPDDILLAIEVSDTTLRFDRRVKMPIYARSHIRESWIVDVKARRVEVYRDPRDGTYAMTTVVERGSSVSPLAFPDVEIAVHEIVP